MAGVGKDVEGPVRLFRDAEAELPEARDHAPAAPVIDDPHRRHLFLAVAQGDDTGLLDEVAGADQEVLVHALQGTHAAGRGDQVAEAPTGHGVGLGKSAEDEGLVGKLENAAFLAGIAQAMVNLVGDHRHRQGGQFLQPGRRQQRAGGVGRRVDQHAAAARAEQLPHRGGPGLEAVFGTRRQKAGTTAGEADEVGITGVARVGKNNLVPRFEERSKQEQQKRAGPRRDDDPLGIDRYPIATPIVGGDLLPQLRQPQGMGVGGGPGSRGLPPRTATISGEVLRKHQVATGAREFNSFPPGIALTAAACYL